MKKILHIPNFYHPHIGGIEDVCQQIVVGLQNDFDQKIICFNDTKKTEIDFVDGVEVIRCGVWKKFFSQAISFGYYSALRKVISSFKPDFIHIHLPNPFVSMLLLCVIPKDTKLIIHWHSDITEPKQQVFYLFYKHFENNILARAHSIVATSPNYTEYSTPLSNFKNKTVVIQNTINTKKLIKKDGDELVVSKIKTKYNKKIIFTFGRHVEYKGYEYLLRAADYLNEDCVIVLAGQGKLTKKLKNLASGKKVLIDFVGRVNDDQLRQYLFASDIFAFPSITKNEAFGLGLAEAQFCGLPGVTFTIAGSGVNWVCLHTVTGLEAENKNIIQYAKNIDILLRDDGLRKTLGRQAKERVMDMFCWDVVVDKIKTIYN